MEIEFVCERCGKRLKVDDALAGQPMECYVCHAETMVPEAGVKAVIEFSCLGCGSQFRVPTSRAGSRTKCPKCGALLVVPDASTRAPAPVDTSLRPAAPEAPTPTQEPAQAAPIMMRGRPSKFQAAPAFGPDGQPIKRPNKTATGMLIFWVALGILFVVAFVFQLSRQNNEPAAAPGAAPGPQHQQIYAEVKFDGVGKRFLVQNNTAEMWSSVRLTVKSGGSEFTATLPSLAPNEQKPVEGDAFSGSSGTFSSPVYPFEFTVTAVLPNGKTGQFTTGFKAPTSAPPATPAPPPAKKTDDKASDGGKVDG